jgi:signal transduction histidine kinase
MQVPSGGPMTGSELNGDELIDLHRRVALADLGFGILHEVKNALGVVEGRGFLAASDIVERQTSHLQLMRGEATRAIKLLESYFSFARPSSTPLAATPLNDSVAAALILAQAHLRLNEIEAIKNLSPSLPPVNGNALQLMQLTLNLLLNGIAALTHASSRPVSNLDEPRITKDLLVRARREDEGVPQDTLRMSHNDMAEKDQRETFSQPQNQSKTITVTTGVSNQMVFLAVSNAGRFADELLEYPVRPFRKGTGLGLFVCQQIALRHHGVLTLSNQQTTAGGLAVVRLELPATSS